MILAEKKTRGSIKPVPVKFKACSKFFASRVVNIWNSLPNNAVGSENVSIFKNIMSKINFSKYLVQQFDNFSIK